MKARGSRKIATRAGGTRRGHRGHSLDRISPGRPAVGLPLTRAQMAKLMKVAAAGGSRSARGWGSVIVVFAGSDAKAKANAVRALAGDMSLTTYRVDVSRTVSKYIGETEKNIGKALADVDPAHALLYLDEADSLFGKRTNVHDAHDRWANAEVAYMFGRLDAFAGVVVVSSEAPARLHPGLRQRARWRVDFPKA